MMGEKLSKARPNSSRSRTLNKEENPKKKTSASATLTRRWAAAVKLKVCPESKVTGSCVRKEKKCKQNVQLKVYPELKVTFNLFSHTRATLTRSAPASENKN